MDPEIVNTIINGVFSIILVDMPTLDIKTCRKAFMMLMFMVQNKEYRPKVLHMIMKERLY